MEAKDFLLDENGDLLIVNGDFVIGNSDEQHIQDIIIAHKGWYKEFPFLGVGLMEYLKSTGLQLELQKQIKLHLQADNYTVNEIIIGDLEKLEIYPNATRNI